MTIRANIGSLPWAPEEQNGKTAVCEGNPEKKWGDIARYRYRIGKITPCDRQNASHRIMLARYTLADGDLDDRFQFADIKGLLQEIIGLCIPGELSDIAVGAEEDHGDILQVRRSL
jgi:hypothetical protein